MPFFTDMALLGTPERYPEETELLLLQYQHFLKLCFGSGFYLLIIEVNRRLTLFYYSYYWATNWGRSFFAFGAFWVSSLVLFCSIAACPWEIIFLWLICIVYCNYCMPFMTMELFGWACLYYFVQLMLSSYEIIFLCLICIVYCNYYMPLMILKYL